MALIRYLVLYKIATRPGRWVRVMTTIEVETPPEDARELESVFLLKLFDRIPDANQIEIISFEKL